MEELLDDVAVYDVSESHRADAAVNPASLWSVVVGVDTFHSLASLLPKVWVVAYPSTVDVAADWGGINVHLAGNLLSHLPGVDQHLVFDHLHHGGTLDANILTCKNRHCVYRLRFS